ncbi:SLAP domain-containing protein [Peribacillus kribbensis]|uniref:SLAP domain-containing protein n=1 Tax=Peribacillus kribbensis TaxID=356658 RepID=UPI0003F56636|nr:SLAP domain-containing protein [Peribacillus kribbensis]
MQTLQFEASWDKALAPRDRENIERIFEETKDLDNFGILCSPIQEAINHKEALLVSVLVHNFTEHELTFQQARLVYSVQGETIADYMFTLPSLTIPQKVSMPWTFIFPKGEYAPHAAYEKGQLAFL